MAKTLADLEGQVDRIQTKLDAEQEQIKQALDDLKAANQELKDQIAQGQIDVASIERISGKLDTLESDLESTIADEPEEEEPTE